MVGPVHTSKPHPNIYETRDQSIFAMNTPTQIANNNSTSNLTPLGGSPTPTTTQSSIPTANPAPTPNPTPTPDPTPPPSSPPPSSPPPSPPPSGGGGGGYGY